MSRHDDGTRTADSDVVPALTQFQLRTILLENRRWLRKRVRRTYGFRPQFALVDPHPAFGGMVFLRVTNTPDGEPMWVDMYPTWHDRWNIQIVRGNDRPQ